MWPNPQQMSLSCKQPQQKRVIWFETSFFFFKFAAQCDVTRIAAILYSCNPPFLPASLPPSLPVYIQVTFSCITAHSWNSTTPQGRDDSAETYRKCLHREGLAAVLNSCLKNLVCIVKLARVYQVFLLLNLCCQVVRWGVEEGVLSWLKVRHLHSLKWRSCLTNIIKQ